MAKVNITGTLRRTSGLLNANNGGERAERAGLLGGRNRRHSAADRFAARVVKGEGDDACWAFTGCRIGRAGYGQIVRENGERVYAHRFAWELEHGQIPAGLTILHGCDNPRCVRVSHLSLGTQGENIADCLMKGRRNAFGQQKLHPTDIYDIRTRVAAGESFDGIAASYHVRPKHIWKIATGRLWRSLGAMVEPVTDVALPIRGEVSA